jgi:hypothetical protein
MTDEPTPDDQFDPDAFDEALARLGSEVDPDRFEELTKIAVAEHPQRDLLVQMMGFPHRFYVEPHGELFDLDLVSLESGSRARLGKLALADVMRKPQG